ncbi:STAS domain-containing protein [Streptomyces niveus]|uniref:Anti-sigma factor antagonist n=1 Tax=Streptomyces niveus TaxID=193462 RepID=A0A1U9R0Q2_STRNV|nr:STAS domain-containing protein [Streptomyces niveus]AQU70074.1 anti-anti-sigma factor [Streptomyces niveus]
MTEPLTLHTRTTAAGNVIELTGDLDHHITPQVLNVLPELDLRPGQQLVIDLGGITFCDSTGISVLIAARNHTLSANATIALAAVPDRMSRIIRVVGLDQLFPTHLTAHDAETAWHPTPG